MNRALLLALPLAWPLLAQTATTHIEENDPSITYTGTWYPNGAAPNSASHATLTNDPGARASLNFTGTGISWVGVADPDAGLARVYLDGVLNTIDTYGQATTYQKVQFSARGLGAGPHSLSIEVMHSRDASGTGSWVWIDGFDIENGAAVTGPIVAPSGRIEQNNPAISYTGTWYLNTNPAQSGGTAVLATDAGSKASITFNGTGIRWVAFRDPWSGIANIYLDGAQTTTVDNYVASDFPQGDGYAVIGLTPGQHTLTIEATGTHSAKSGASWIWVDAFDILK